MENFWKQAGEHADRLAAARRLLVTLDFDGTLAALASSPGQARLKPEYRAALRLLARAPGVSVFVLSGRALAGLRRLVGLPGLYYGGNHGAEIAGPGFEWRDKAACSAGAALRAAAAAVKRDFLPATGVLVEDKGCSVSVHYRNLKPALRGGFFARLRALMAAPGGDLRWRRGHKVYEVLPRLAPHKGHALELLRRRLRADLALAAGDDVTDEDMFRALAGRGLAVRVGRRAGSAARYYLRGQGEVLRLLRLLRECRAVKNGGK
jgi:trehalose 6-phosphate phosphatase